MEAMLEREKVRQEVKKKNELTDRELNEHRLANERDREDRSLKIQAQIERETNDRWDRIQMMQLLENLLANKKK